MIRFAIPIQMFVVYGINLTGARHGRQHACEIDMMVAGEGFGRDLGDCNCYIGTITAPFISF
jgi:hypothetical protein